MKPAPRPRSTCLRLALSLLPALVALAFAQPATTPRPALSATNQLGTIEAKRAVMSFFTGLGVFSTNVVVTDPEMILTCQFLKVQFAVKDTNATSIAPVAPSTNQAAGTVWNGQKVQWADSQGSVVITDFKNDMRVSGEKVFYSATNNLFKMSGPGIIVQPHNATTNWAALETNAALIKPRVITIGDDMVFDRSNRVFYGDNYKTYLWEEYIKRSKDAQPAPEKK